MQNRPAKPPKRRSKWGGKGQKGALGSLSRSYGPEGRGFESLMACHRRRGLRIVRGDDSFQNHRLSRTSSLLLPKPDPLSLGSGFVLFLAVAEVLNDCCKYYGFPLRSPPYLRSCTQRETKFLSRRGKSLMAWQNPTDFLVMSVGFLSFS